MGQHGAGTGWHAWPEEYRSPFSPSVSSFARQHEDEIRFHMWLQWLAHVQLSQAADHARKAGLRIGFYLDLAVGEALDGSATWSEQDAYLSKATIGSPPDPFATEGQDWHLAAIHPSRIAAGKNSPYRRMVMAAMRYAGAIRIDHAAATDACSWFRLIAPLMAAPMSTIRRMISCGYSQTPRRDINVS